MEYNYKNLRIAENGAKINVIVYIILSILKLSIGYFFNSKALFADGINNSTDIIASLAIMVGLRISRKPADYNHAYGHLRAQTISSLVASLVMIAAGLNVLYNAIYAIIFYKSNSQDIISIVVGIICTVTIYIVYRYNKNVAIRINSSALMAAAKDNLSDTLVGIGTVIGIAASGFGLPWIDPVAAALVGMVIIKTGLGIFKESAYSLTDGFDSKRLDGIISKIKLIRGVNCVKDIKARVHGSSILIDVVIGVDSQLTVAQSHKITINIEKMLNDDFKINYAIIHVEPECI
ncbi:cation diffusion facilitator family transporter [Clostridium tyrobutyricum]|jgi:cation diffusion facilitator family transporter|uniref:Cobalt-zinc-cadmium resistance protein n=1 Tax=Clostridium tyrobutyricum DIVETGP TaxID=1408889 RepID=W6N7S1_CLOTY|nr:cation diffusion facilitator family transporter [Clostridium tyrobutyricum]AND84714.1 Co/Zn/Cd cation transporter [Clostridium tyrobutyricum]ANP69309.1 transporter [Clostridium tyrobutyricum]MBR9648376.1 cation transporter [Clostridium tyrobutyricum]MBV4417338.1 cation diffusion facilitator family transporter [Clostridium tyrobutyricum]MBV4423079.1 cation diffusion facilitator family transporter [Clostridium tyrobutyricum]